MKLKIFYEDDMAAGADVSAGGSIGMSDISGVNTSAGSNVVNYGPNNPYFSNLREQEAQKKKKEKKRYGSKNAGHRGSKRRFSDEKRSKFKDDLSW